MRFLTKMTKEEYEKKLEDIAFEIQSFVTPYGLDDDESPLSRTLNAGVNKGLLKAITIIEKYKRGEELV